MKKDPKLHQNRLFFFLNFWKILSLVFPGNDLIPFLAKYWFSSYGPKCCWLVKLQDSLKCNISIKKWMVKFIFGMQINIEVFYKVIIRLWVCTAMHAQITQNKKFVYLYNVYRKMLEMIFFCLQINTKVFYKLIVSIWVCVARHAQRTQNNEFVISSQYLK